MKTFTFLPTLLALIIQVMVNGQTQSNQAGHRSLNVIGANTQPKKEKVYPTLVSTVENETATSAIKTTPAPETSVKTNEVKSTEAVIDNNTYNYYNNANCYATAIFAKELLKEADDLLAIEKTIRAEAKTKQGAEKLQLTKSAKELFKQAELKQIQASEISGKISAEKYKLNNIVFNNMCFTSLAGEIVLNQAKDINQQAVHSFKMAKEMREEAYSFKNNTAKLGTMNNAEEKEGFALNKQGEAIGILKHYLAALQSPLQNDLVSK